MLCKFLVMLMFMKFSRITLLVSFLTCKGLNTFGLRSDSTH